MNAPAQKPNSIDGREVIHVPGAGGMPALFNGHENGLPTLSAVWSLMTHVVQVLRDEFLESSSHDEEIVELRKEIATLKQENKDLRDMKTAFAEVRANVSENNAKVERLDFSITRIAADRKGEPGRDGADGKVGPRGLRGEKGSIGPAGISGREISGWEIDAPAFEARPIMSDGRKGAVLDLFEMFHAAYKAGQLADDAAEADDYAEARSREILGERIRLIRGES
jgi:hypothetical protein